MSNAELVAFIRKNPISVGCGVLALALGGAIYFRSSGLPAATALLEQKSVEGERLATNLRHGAQLAEQLTAITAAGKTIESRFIRPGELANNLQYFYKLEADTGTKLIDLRQNTTVAAGKAAKPALAGIAFSVGVQGEYFAVLEFLRRLEDGAHYCRVMSAGMSAPAPDRGGAVKLALSVELLGQP